MIDTKIDKTFAADAYRTTHPLRPTRPAAPPPKRSTATRPT